MDIDAIHTSETPLYVSAKHDRVDCLRILLKFGADANATTQKGHTPLHVASKQGHTRIVRVLLDEGDAVLESRSYLGESPLFVACKFGHA